MTDPQQSTDASAAENTPPRLSTGSAGSKAAGSSGAMQSAPSAAVWIFAGGGTGGHLTPGLAVAKAAVESGKCGRAIFVGTDRPVEQRMLDQAGFEHIALPLLAPGTLRRNPLQFVWSLAAAFWRAWSLIGSLRPRAIIGLGGYASVPAARAASSLDIPYALLEQNAVPGRATRWLAPASSAMFSAIWPWT